MNNNISSLNNYLFESIERINDDDLTDKELDREIKKGKAINAIAQTIVQNGTLALRAQLTLGEHGNDSQFAKAFLEEK